MMTPVFVGLKEKHPDHDVHLLTDSTYMDGALPHIASRCWAIDVVHDVPLAQATTIETIGVQRVVSGGDVHRLDVVRRAVGLIDLNNVCLVAEQTSPDPPHRTVVWSDAAGVAPSDMRPVYRTTKMERRRAKEEFDRRGWTGGRGYVVGLSLSAMDVARALPDAAILDVVATIREAGGVPVTVDPVATIPGVDSIAGRRLPEVFALIERMDAFVGVDSGLLHVAGAVDTPVVGLFGSIPARKRMAYYRGYALQTNLPCAPCYYRQPCRASDDPATHFACMKGFTGEMVRKALEIVLSGNPASSKRVE